MTLPRVRSNFTRKKSYSLKFQEDIVRRKVSSNFERPVLVTDSSKALYREALRASATKFFKNHVDKKTSRRVNVRGNLVIATKVGWGVTEKRVKRADGKGYRNKLVYTRKKGKGVMKEATLNLAAVALVSRKEKGLQSQVDALMEVIDRILEKYDARAGIGGISFTGFSFDAVVQGK